MSVLITVFNAERFVDWTLRTVLEQTVRDLDVIVVDDASTDATGRIVRSFDDPRLRYVAHRENRGVSAARNTGLAAAEAPYVAFLDGDDGMKPANLERKLDVLERHPNVALVHGGAEAIDVQGRPVAPPGRAQPVSGDVRVERLFRHLLFRNTITFSSVVARKGVVVEAGGFDEGLRYMEDWDLFVRLAREWDFAYLAEPLVWYRIHPTGASQAGAMDARVANLDRVLSKAFAAFPLEREGLDYDEVYRLNYFRVLANRTDVLPFGEAVSTYLAAIRARPRALTSYSALTIPFKLAARALLPRAVLDRRRYRRHAASLAGRDTPLTRLRRWTAPRA